MFGAPGVVAVYGASCLLASVASVRADDDEIKERTHR
jgi:hypothetical protein